MPKSLFPLNPEYEDDKFDDPDKKFNELPYSSEVPERTPYPYRFPPFTYQFFAQNTCRENVATATFFGFAICWCIMGPMIATFRYGNAVTRWRQLWCCVEAGCIGCGTAAAVQMFYNPNCSPYMTGRRRSMFYEESLRHSLNAKFRIFENIEKIMISKERITKLEFYEAFQETLDENNILGQEKLYFLGNR